MWAEAPDGQAGAVDRERRHHHVDARAVRQARVAHRRGLVDAAPERSQHPLDRVQQLGVRPERDVGALDDAAPLDPDVARPDHHHLVDGRIGQQRLERPEPGRQANDPRGQGLAGIHVQRRSLVLDEAGGLRLHPSGTGGAVACALDQPPAQ